MRSEEIEDEDDEDPREKISLEEVNLPLPSATDGITFETFIRNKHDLESFKEFLERTNNKGSTILFLIIAQKVSQLQVFYPKLAGSSFSV